VATLSGTFTGVGSAASATSLKFKATANITLDSTTGQNLKFHVLDQNDNTLFSFNEDNIKAGDKVYLGDDIGPYVAFSAGTVVPNATGTSAVTRTPTHVDSAAIFNDANPNLRPRFDRGAQITAGEFKINGTSIGVNANDSINSVLARINSTVSGVTASFANDKISIVNNSGSNPVVLSNDTSGFLAATKLSAAVTTKGHIRDDEQVLAKTSQFGSVTSGAFTINGVSILPPETKFRSSRSVKSKFLPIMAIFGRASMGSPALRS
jgi:hypothetical protein